MVLGPFLTDGFLHRAVREQGGAYGGGASYSTGSGAFRFYSYRDPRLAETLSDFRQAVTWLHEERHEPRQLEEAILRVVSDIDRPESPAGEAVADFFGSLHGRTPDHRREFRRAVLDVELEDLKRVGGKYLLEAEASTAVVSNDANLESDADLGLEICRI
jgi:Zn-dependent M16 (insulinase) family peptidase